MEGKEAAGQAGPSRAGRREGRAHPAAERAPSPAEEAAPPEALGTVHAIADRCGDPRARLQPSAQDVAVEAAARDVRWSPDHGRGTTLARLPLLRAASRSLYLQFDIEDRFDLAFPAGSHVLVFHCPTCEAVPLGFWRQGDEWLKPDYRALYRIIVNPPGAREFLHEIDPRIVEQRVTFAKRKERVTKNLDGPVGVEEVKIGGLPHWVQPPDYPRCACGAAMGFLLQVPAMKNADWKQEQSDAMPWGGGLDTFVFACTRPCSPYAAVMVSQR